MSSAATLLFVSAAVVAVVDWAAVARSRREVEYVCKPGALALLIAATVTLDPASDTQRWWFTAALVLSLAGDVFLMLPTDLFTAGLVAFLLAHIAYVAGFRTVGSSAVGLAIAAAVVVLLGAAIGGRIIASMHRDGHDTLVVPVVAYMIVISAMVASALASGSARAGAGAALFFVSDTLIAWNRFVSSFRGDKVAIIATYHLGQLGLALSLVR